MFQRRNFDFKYNCNSLIFSFKESYNKFLSQSYKSSYTKDEFAKKLEHNKTKTADL